MSIVILGILEWPTPPCDQWTLLALALYRQHECRVCTWTIDRRAAGTKHMAPERWSSPHCIEKDCFGQKAPEQYTLLCKQSVSNNVTVHVVVNSSFKLVFHGICGTSKSKPDRQTKWSLCSTLLWRSHKKWLPSRRCACETICPPPSTGNKKLI